MEKPTLTSTELPFLDEDTVKALISADDALNEMRKLFAQLSLGLATNFPVIREMVGSSVFGVKSGSHVELGLLGLKAGGYFPANALTGGTKHQSVVMLFDPTTGKPTALVAGNLITRLRTAAAAAMKVGEPFNPQVFGRLMSQLVYRFLMEGRPLVDARGSAFDPQTGRLHLALKEPLITKVEVRMPAESGVRFSHRMTPEPPPPAPPTNRMSA